MGHHTDDARARRLARGAVLAFAFGVAFVPRAALADDARTRAQVLFQEGLADVQRKDFASACPKFRASYEAEPRSSTLLNLGICYETDGKLASAWGAYREAELVANRTRKAPIETEAAARAEAVEKRLARVTLTAPKPAPPGLALELDGKPFGVGSLGVALPFDAGEHVLRAKAPGFEPSTTRFAVANAEVLEVKVPALVRARSAALPSADAPRSSWPLRRSVGVVVATAGVAALGTAGVLGIVAKRNYDDARAGCDGGDATRCAPDRVLAGEDARGLARTGTFVAVAGAAFAVIGVTLVLWPASDDRRAKSIGLRAGPSGAALDLVF